MDPAIMPLVLRDFTVSGKSVTVKLNDVNFEVSSDFKLYLVSNMSYPHFKPEVQSKTSLCNFAITMDGLQQQLLSLVCYNENKKDEEKRDQLI